MENTSESLLLILTRNPVLGKCKTRLAATIGDEKALEIYKFLLEHTLKITEKLNVVKEVHYSEEIWVDDIWSNETYIKKLQEGDDLGERMANAFRNGFKSGFKKIVVIGSDMFDLAQTDLENAFELLNTKDYIIGPAVDGGYYLLGMRLFNQNLFVEKAWGTDTVLRDTLKNLEKENFGLLDVRNDIDYYEDIEHIAAFQPFLKNN